MLRVFAHGPGGIGFAKAPSVGTPPKPGLNTLLVDLSPSAWSQVGRLSAAEFEAFRSALDTVCIGFDDGRNVVAGSPGAEESVRSFRFGDAEVWFRVDRGINRLTVLDILRTDLT